jgi:hypothetical protein
LARKLTRKAVMCVLSYKGRQRRGADRIMARLRSETFLSSLLCHLGRLPWGHESATRVHRRSANSERRLQ